MTRPPPLPKLKSQYLPEEECQRRGYTPFAGYFAPEEYSMIPNFERDLISAKRDYVGSTGPTGVMLWQKLNDTEKLDSELAEETE